MRASWLPVLLLAACGTTPVPPLAYAPATALPAPGGKPVVAMVAVTDGRAQDGHAQDPRWIGIAQGDISLPTRSLATPTRVVDEVDRAFVSAMLGRGLLAPAGTQRYDLTVNVVRLDGEQRLGLSGRADFALTVTRHGGGPVIYRDEVTAQVDGGAFPSLDTLAFVPTGDVALATSAAMSRAIDEALGKPAFRAAVRS